jgi:hypothetical protein
MFQIGPVVLLRCFDSLCFLFLVQSILDKDLKSVIGLAQAEYLQQAQSQTCQIDKIQFVKGAHHAVI